MDESFSDGLLEYPQYSRPEVWNGKKVPDVLLSGHHANIEKWRREQSLLLTKERRPDLFEKVELTKKDKKFLEAVKSYMYLKVRLLFDPPASSTVMESMNRLANEFEWRLYIAVDYKQSE